MQDKASNDFNLAFFGSSQFVLPILESIKNNREESLREIFLRQLQILEKIVDVSPGWWLENKDDLRGLVESHPIFDKKPNLQIVVSQPDRQNRNKTVSNPVVVFARENGFRCFLPEKINSVKAEFAQICAGELDLAIVASFGQIISTDVLEMAKYGFVNWHPSKLPLYRGATPMQTALNNGDESTALSWINMTKAMDAGNIWLQVDKKLNGIRNFGELAIQMGQLGGDTWSLVIVAKILEVILEKESDNWLRPLIQDENQVTFCKMLTKEDKIVSPSAQTATEIYNHFRAFSSFPGTAFLDEYFEEEIKILDCSLPLDPVDTSLESKYGNWVQTKNNKQNRIFLNCKNNTLLEVSKVGRQNGKQLDFSGFQFG